MVAFGAKGLCPAGEGKKVNKWTVSLNVFIDAHCQCVTDSSFVSHALLIFCKYYYCFCVSHNVSGSVFT